MIDVLERNLRDVSELLLGQSSCGTRSDQGRVETRDLRTNNRIRVARGWNFKSRTSRFNSMKAEGVGSPLDSSN